MAAAAQRPVQMLLPLLLLLLLLVAIAHALPADLGNFGTHNDLNGISSFSLPAEERMIAEQYVTAYVNYSYVAANGQEVHFAEEKAKYGEGRIFNVRGLLVHVTSRYDVNDHTACSPLLRGTRGFDLPPAGTWVALIKRGNCNFEDKVKHAWMHKALGVIVYNDRDSNMLDKMKITERERNITAVFTFKWLGEQMAQIVEEGNDLYTSISEGRYTKNSPNINRTSVLFVSISFIVLMIISLVWLIFYYVQRFRYLQTKDRKSRHLCSMAKRIIAKIPTKSIKSDDKQIENDCCAICIEPYKVTDLVRMLPCRHDFHKSCIDPWLLEHRTCPMCKMDILKHYGFVFTGSQESILQMDLDTEDGDQQTIDIIGFGIDQPRERSQSVSQTFHLDNELRHSSVESIASLQSSGQTETHLAKISGGGAPKCIDCLANMRIKAIENEMIDEEEHECTREDSISLPCTLKRCRNECRGSNNCYIWGLDYKQLGRKISRLEQQQQQPQPQHSHQPDEATALRHGHGSANYAHVRCGAGGYPKSRTMLDTSTGAVARLSGRGLYGNREVDPEIADDDFDDEDGFGESDNEMVLLMASSMTAASGDPAATASSTATNAQQHTSCSQTSPVEFHVSGTDRVAASQTDVQVELAVVHQHENADASIGDVEQGIERDRKQPITAMTSESSASTTNNTTVDK